MNRLGSVVDSVTGGSKNGSSVPVRRGTLRAKKHVRDRRDSCKGGRKSGSFRSVLRETVPRGL